MNTRQILKTFVYDDIVDLIIKIAFGQSDFQKKCKIAFELGYYEECEKILYKLNIINLSNGSKQIIMESLNIIKCENDYLNTT